MLFNQKDQRFPGRLHTKAATCQSDSSSQQYAVTG